MFNAERIFILAPHTDDGELGCGGFIAKHIAAGSEVFYIAFSTCSESLPKELPADTLSVECAAATAALGIPNGNLILFDFTVRHLQAKRQEVLEELIVLKNKYQPTMVLLPAQHDIHQDHQAIYEEGLRAFKHSTILGYELPWNNWRFQPTYFESIPEEALFTKTNALKHYKSQEKRDYMQESFIRSLAIVRGIQSGVPLAEAFEVYRMIR
ncbi:MAG TPA: PIG-L family deacetylase [Chitinophagaceae bacterium]